MRYCQQCRHWRRYEMRNGVYYGICTIRGRETSSKHPCFLDENLIEFLSKQ